MFPLALPLFGALAACGSTGPTQLAVPATRGRPVQAAFNALCDPGARVTLNQTLVGSARSVKASAEGAAAIRVTGTTPPAGSRVQKGSVVILHDTVPDGIEAFFSGKSCLAPVEQTTTISPAVQAGIAQVEQSAPARAVAAEFPTTAASRVRVVLHPPATRIPALCSTSASGGPGLVVVTFTESWSSPHPAKDSGAHIWSFYVQPHHLVQVGMSAGQPALNILG